MTLQKIILNNLTMTQAFLSVSIRCDSCDANIQASLLRLHSLFNQRLGLGSKPRVFCLGERTKESTSVVTDMPSARK